MLQIQNSLLKNNCSFSFSAIISYLESLSKPLLLNDSKTLDNRSNQIESMFEKFKNLKGRRLAQAYSMIDILLFNLSMTLERTRIVFENTLVESTGTQEFDQKKIVDRAEQIERNINQIISKVLRSKNLEELLLLSSDKIATKSVQISSLIQTLQFISDKYSQPFSPQIKQKISHLLIPPTSLNSSHFQLIKKLFNNNSSYFIQLLQTDVAKHMSLCQILHANDPKRPMFSSVIPTQHVINNLVTFMLKDNNNKSYLLFSNQHYNSSLHCKFVVDYMIFEFIEIIVKFNKILLKFNMQQTQAQYYSHNLSLFNEIYVIISQYNSSPFSQFLSTIFKVIKTKYSTEQSIQVMKLLILNKFLLNPQVNNLVTPINEHFSIHANKIKNIFFPSKLKHIQEIKSVSISCYSILSKLCQCNQKPTQRTLFVPDKILKLGLNEIENKVEPAVLPTNIRHAPSTPSVSNTSIAKNLLLDLDLKPEYQQLSSTQMMEWLIQFKRQLNHKTNQRARYNKICEESDAKNNQDFKNVSDRFKEWKQVILESKRAYKNNAVVQF